MTDTPYSEFQSERLILRDRLAIDRTKLANERTLLAYLRSGVALFIAGASIMHFAANGWFRVLGIACMPAGIVTAVIGTVRFHRMDRSMLCIGQNQKQGESK